MKPFILLLIISSMAFTRLNYDSDGEEIPNIIGTWKGKTLDSIFYQGTWVEAYDPVTVTISYPDKRNSRINNILFDDYKIESALNHVLQIKVIKKKGNTLSTEYDGLIIYDRSSPGYSEIGLEYMIYFKYDNLSSGELKLLGVSRMDDSLRVTVWDMDRRYDFPNSEDKPYINLYESLQK